MDMSYWPTSFFPMFSENKAEFKCFFLDLPQSFQLISDASAVGPWDLGIHIMALFGFG